VRWYLRFNLSYRDVEELLAEREIEVDHVTVYRWVRRFTGALLAGLHAARSARQPTVLPGPPHAQPILRCVAADRFKDRFIAM
jgi:hypothetical protein